LGGPTCIDIWTLLSIEGIYYRNVKLTTKKKGPEGPIFLFVLPSLGHSSTAGHDEHDDSEHNHQETDGIALTSSQDERQHSASQQDDTNQTVDQLGVPVTNLTILSETLIAVILGIDSLSVFHCDFLLLCIYYFYSFY